MKKGLFIPAILMMVILLSMPAFGAEGATVTTNNYNLNNNTMFIKIVIEADASNGSVDSITTSNNSKLQGAIAWAERYGYYPYYAEVDPTTGTAPTTLFDVTLVDGNSRDLACTELTNLSESAINRKKFTYTTPVVSTTLTVAVSGNSVNSADIVIYLWLVK